MAISVTCPFCSRQYSVKDRELGKTMLCRTCRKEFIVGGPVAKGPTETGSDPAGRASLVLGILGLCGVMLVCCTLGYSLFGAVPVALAGLVLGFYGKGASRVAGPILNGVVLVMALGWVMLIAFSPTRNQPTGTEPETLPGMRGQEIKTLP